MAGILEGIEAAIRKAAPLWDVECGYSLDAVSWAVDSRVSKPTILLSHEGDEPDQPREDGYVRKFIESYAVHIRTGAVSREQMTERVRPQYLAIRAALNGLQVKDEDGKDRQVRIEPGRMERAAGIGFATLSLRVV